MPRTDVCANCKENLMSIGTLLMHVVITLVRDFELDKDLEVWGTIDDIGQFYEMDSEESRADVPEGFRWSCCQRVGDVEGRHEEQHVAVLEYSPLTMGNFGEGNRAEPEVEILGERSRDKRKAEEDIIGIAQKVRTGP
ncbi:hypothetical protein CaCOL14_012071 [Colletotrichum acutatum]